MTLHRFTAIPLTPIHIGDGTTLAPDAYLIDGDTLCRFAPARVIADMAPAARRAYVQALDRGELQDAQELLRKAVDRKRHVEERVPATAAAAGLLKNVLANPDAKGEVRPFIRTGGRPYLPGTSLKGAIRTALVSAYAMRLEADKRTRLGAMVPKLAGDKSAPLSDATQRLALQLAEDEHHTDTDPFRFVEVGDVPLPEGSTLYDQVVNWRKDAPKTFTMHVERLRSEADGGGPAFPVTLDVDPERSRRCRELDHRKAPRIDISAEEALAETNRFHWQRFEEERDNFFTKLPETIDLLEGLFRLQRADGTKTDMASVRADPSLILLRVGRYGQFESKSVDEFRRGWDDKAKVWIKGHGKTRNIVKLAPSPGGAPTPVPMGWLLLAPEGAFAEPRRVRPAGPAPKPSSPTPPQRTPRRATVDGAPVEILGRDGTQVQIRFLDTGDIESVDESELD